MELLKNFWFIQGIGAVALIFVVITWNTKARRDILRRQIINLSFFSVHYFLLGALAGAAMSVICIARNLVFMQNHKQWAAHRAWFYFFLALSVGVLVVFWKGPITILPVAGVILGMHAISQEKPANIRFWMLIAGIIWLPYTLVVHSYSGLISNSISIIAILIGMYRHDRKLPQ